MVYEALKVFKDEPGWDLAFISHAKKKTKKYVLVSEL